MNPVRRSREKPIKDHQQEHAVPGQARKVIEQPDCPTGQLRLKPELGTVRASNTKVLAHPLKVRRVQVPKSSRLHVEGLLGSRHRENITGQGCLLRRGSRRRNMPVPARFGH